MKIGRNVLNNFVLVISLMVIALSFLFQKYATKTLGGLSKIANFKSVGVLPRVFFKSLAKCLQIRKTAVHSDFSDT